MQGDSIDGHKEPVQQEFCSADLYFGHRRRELWFHGNYLEKWQPLKLLPA